MENPDNICAASSMADQFFAVLPPIWARTLARMYQSAMLSGVGEPFSDVAQLYLRHCIECANDAGQSDAQRLLDLVMAERTKSVSSTSAGLTVH